MELSRKNRIIAIGSAGALAIGLAAVSIPIAQHWGATTSSEGSIAVSGSQENDAATAIGQGVATSMTVADSLTSIVEDPADAIHWLIPVDAPLATFPPGDLCSLEQRAWLVDNAEPYRLDVLPVRARVHNTADSGSAVALTNVRLDGEWIDVTPTVHFFCIGIGDTGTQSIQLHADSSPGTWSASNGWESNPQPEGSIATLNLSAGEVAELNLELPVANRDFVGRVVADLVGDVGVVAVLAENVSFPARPLAGYSLGFPGADGIECVTPASILGAPCTYSEAEALLREAGRLANR